MGPARESLALAALHRARPIALASHLHPPCATLTGDRITTRLVQRLAARLRRQYLLVPLVEVDDELTVAMTARSKR